MGRNIDLDTRIVQTERPLAAELDGDQAVLMSVRQGVYYGLNEVARRILDLTETPVSLHAICEVLIEEYDVDRATCERDVRDYAAELLEQDLVRITDAPGNP